ncbi:MAG: sigma-70 family RNA polymerase sigma factor [Planctomycetota bacterium]|nr:sigma-70 family RNA polymerase sigma factor [Planctomycetota bacterium]
MNPTSTSSSSIGSTSSSLIQRIKAQDADAWTKLVRLYGPLVDFWLSREGLDGADVEDVFQDVFTTVARGIADFRKDRPGDTFRGWLRTIVHSRAVDHFRRSRGRLRAAGGSEFQQRLQNIEAPAASDGDGPEETRQIQDVRLRALELIRSQFEPRTWEAFWRVTVEGHTTADVAQDQGITPSAVRLAKSRVLRRLREELGDLEP